MRNKLIDNLYESFMSIMPITLVIMSISFLCHLDLNTIFAFIISSFLLMIGMTLFTIGADMSMIIIGKEIGDFMVKKKMIILILLASLIIGIVITMSEPDLNVFAKEITSIPSHLIIRLVSLGIGIFLMIGVYRILKNHSFRFLITIIIFLIFGLLCFVPSEFISIAFDGGAVTTGPVGVPLILAFGYGITKIRSDNDAKSDSFGLCGLASLGPIVAILFLGLFFKPNSYFDTAPFTSSLPLIERFLKSIISCFKDVCISVLPIIFVFLGYWLINRKLAKNTLIKIGVGFVFVIVGLTIFLVGVSVGFMDTGFNIGNVIADSKFKYLLVPLGMLLGYIIINAEPAVKILNKQIYELTEGSISENMINLCLSFGVCIAIGLSMIRILFQIPIIYFIVPGYLLVLFLIYKTPRMFITIAFDSGGAASGAMTTSFLLPLCIGACEVLKGDILTYAFGVGALVALSPIITIQILGIIYDKRRRVMNKEKFDEEIIDFIWEG